MVASFLRGSPKTFEDKGKETSPEPPVVEFSQWVPWKAERYKTLEWWTELSAVPGKEDSRKLAREMRASFGLPWWLQEFGSKEATFQAPPALPCLCRQKFMPPADSIFACRDIREILRRKRWCMLELSSIGWSNIICLLEVSHNYWQKAYWELREEVKWYLSFTDEEVFCGVALPKKEEEDSQQTLCASDISNTHCAPEPALGERAPKFLGWEKVLHPSHQWWLLGRSPNQPGPQG